MGGSTSVSLVLNRRQEFEERRSLVMKMKRPRDLLAVCAASVLMVAAMDCEAQEQRGALDPENANEARLNRIQPPDKVLAAIGLEAGMVVGEIGAGRGRYTVQIAHRVGEDGKVYANDIDAAALRYLEQRCARWGYGNVEAVVGEATDPRFPEGELDLIFMISTYHHISRPIELMRNALPALKPDGKLAIAEWVPSSVGEGTSSATPPAVLEEQMNDAGYELEETVLFPSPTNSFNIYILVPGHR